MQIDTEYLQHINKNISLEPEIYFQSSMQLVGMNTCFYSVDSEKNNIGDSLPPLWEDFLGRLDEVPHRIPRLTYGIVHQSSVNPEQLDYYAATQVSRVDSLPDGMAAIELPPSQYAKFEHRGQAGKIDSTVNYIYSNWLMQSGKKHNYLADIEFYDERYHPTSTDSVMHYAIPVE